MAEREYQTLKRYRQDPLDATGEPESYLIGDAGVRNVVTQLGDLTAAGIELSNRRVITQTIPLEPHELDLWEAHFSLVPKTLDAADAGELLVLKEEPENTHFPQFFEVKKHSEQSLLK